MHFIESRVRKSKCTEEKMESETKQHKPCLMLVPSTKCLPQFISFHKRLDIIEDNLFNRYLNLNLDINIGVLI